MRNTAIATIRWAFALVSLLFIEWQSCSATSPNLAQPDTMHMKKFFTLFFLMAIISLPAMAQTTYTFNGASGFTGWIVPENWTGGVVPPDPLPVGDAIVIAANCTRTWYTTINGTITVNSGVTLTITNAGEDLTFTINGVGHNYGTINANDEDLVTGSGGSFTNYSGASVQATATLAGIANDGQFTNEAGATVNVWGVGNSGTFTNAGAATIGFGWTNLAGSTLNNSGNLTNTNGSGFLNNVAGATINLSGGIIQLSCGITNNGAISLSGGDLRLLRNPVVWPTGLNWTSGTITIGGGFTIGSGLTVTVPASGTLLRTNGQPMIIGSGGSLVVNGAFTPQSGFFEVQSGGTFNIGSGGAVTFANTALNSSGTVDNAGTLNLNQASGQFLNNGAFSNSGTVNIARLLRNSGTLTNTGTININSNGTLELNTNPAALPGGTLNWNSNGTILIGTNGGFTLDNLLTVPSGCFFTVQSTQPFTVSAGGQLVNNGTVSLSNSPSVNNGTITNNSNFTLQTGSLTNDGTLNNSSFFTIRSAFTNNGTLNQTGGNIYFCIPISDLQPGGTFNWSGGTMNLGRPSVCTCAATQNTPYVLPSGRSWSVNASSSLTNGSTITIPQTSSITVFGSLVNNSTIQNNGIISPFGGSSFTNNGLIKGTGSQQGTVGFTNGPNGTIAPGASPGCYGFLQGFTNQGTLSMEIDGTTFCSQYDRLSNSGTTTLGGTLNLTFSITPTVGQTFTIVTSSSIVGSFSTINVTPGNINVSHSGGVVTVVSVISPPACTALTDPANAATNVPANTPLSWPAASGSPDGYRLDVGTTPGGTDILNNFDVGNVTTYDPPGLFPYGTTIYVKIVPYNGGGPASGCTGQSFTTGNCIANLTLSFETLMSGAYRSQGDLNAFNIIIPTGQTVIFTSDTGIIIPNDFTVDAGAVFTAEIQTCP